jgi:hypothetical protein
MHLSPPDLVVLAVVLFCATMAQLVFRGARLSLLWGALWGIAAGAWLIAPPLVKIHRLHPTAWSEWLILDLALTIAFGLLGAALAFFWYAPVLAAMRRRRSAASDAAYALGIAAILPPAYMIVSYAIGWANFSRFPALAAYESALLRVSPIYFAVCGLLVLTNHRTARHPTSWIRAGLRGAVGAIAVAGFLILPFRVGSPPVRTAPLPERLVRSSVPRPRPLFILGLDSGNWRTLDPLLRRGRLPTLQRLIDNGRRGVVDALWPPYWSMPAWAAIVTGFGQSETGVHEDLTATLPGLPTVELPMQLDPLLNPVLLVEYGAIKARIIETMLTPRPLLQRPPIWELLTKAGVRTAVIHFPFTFPPDHQATLVLSNRTVPDLWSLMGVVPGDRSKLVAPAESREDLLQWFSPDRTPDDGVLREILPRTGWPQPADLSFPPADILRTVLDGNQRLFNVTEHIIRTRPDVDVVMVYISAFDNVCHAFWPYRFPEDFPQRPPAPADVRELGPVIDRYLEFFDRRLGEILAGFREPPNVILISDHGHEGTDTNSLWRAWHGREGIFIESGPDVAPDDRDLQVSYFDMVPTILDFEGFATPPIFKGQSQVVRPDVK